jgi:hypothetical protein
MRRILVLLVALAALVIAPGASPQVPELPEQVPAVCGTFTGAEYALEHVTVETPGHVPGEHRGCAGFPF